MYLAQLGPGTRRTMARALETLAELASVGQVDADTLPWELRYQHVAAIRAALVERMAPATVNKQWAATRLVLVCACAVVASLALVAVIVALLANASWYVVDALGTAAIAAVFATVHLARDRQDGRRQSGRRRPSQRRDGQSHTRQ